MKKIVIFSLMVLFLLVHLGADTGKRQLMQKIYQLYEKEEYSKILPIIEQAIKNYGSSIELHQLKYDILLRLKKYEEALIFVNEEIKRSGETEALLSAQYNVLFLQGELPEALKVAMKKYKIANPKSPWDCMNIMHVYLRMGNKEDALDWLQEAVKRGFISYRILEDKKYALLDKEKRFYDIIENIKMNIGLGYRARNFSVNLLSGEEFTLANQRGKVVMIYFWATWCEPCKKEIPHLNQYYLQFKDKGFEILSINLDSNIERMKEYSQQYKLEWKHVCSGNVWQDKTVVLYGVNSVPSLWLVDKKGILRSFDVKGEELGRVIAYLLAE